MVVNADDRFNPTEVQARWRKIWERVQLDTPNLIGAKKPFFNLMMFPYPSAEGLHVGNMYAFTGSDIYGRFKRMAGYDTFQPIGLDGFGIHSENFAFKVGRHPMDQAVISEKRFYNQLHTIGAMYDWTRTVETYNPDYYRFTQWLFVQMFKHGLAYRGKAEVNWCPSCKTVLADEQVIENTCERCGNTVQKRQLEQWFFRITAYAEKLLQHSYSLDWSEKILIAQKNWIGKKTGINISYEVKGREEKINCFTTTPVNWAATFLVLSPEHPLALKLTKSDRLRDVKSYIDIAKKTKPEGRIAQGREKTGVFTGSYAVNHVTHEDLPIWISDFVIMTVGTGAIQGCPGHDMRDFEFAMKYHLPIKRVVVGPDGDTSPIDTPMKVIHAGHPGTMIHSEFLNGLPYAEAMEKTKDYFEKKGWGKRVATYHLRDWLISRQRYWGPPIPMVYCAKCAKEGNSWFTSKEATSKASFHHGAVVSKESMKQWNNEMAGWYPVNESELPVVLPRIEDYKPGDDGVAPLAKHKEFYETECPGCGKKAVRETDVSDTFLDSSWYFLRYPSVGVTENVVGENNGHRYLERAKNAGSFGNFEPSAEGAPAYAGDRRTREIDEATSALPWDPQITRHWLPVPMYTGGAEHSVLHLMYSRFVTMALHDMGYIEFDEPFVTFYAHGLIIKDGAKMSKSKGNVVNPDEYIARYGTDALRLYLMFTGPYDQGGDFRDSAMEGMYRWVTRVWKLALRSIAIDDSSDTGDPSDPSKHSSSSSATIKKALHKAIKKVGEDIERRRYNTAIAAMMELINTVVEEGGVMSIEDLKDFLKILAPFAPYMTEELWQHLHLRGAAHPRGGGIAAKGGKGHLGGESVSQYTFTKSNSIHFQPWPAYDPKLLEEDTVEIIVQVNGKLRDTIEVQRAQCAVQSDVEKVARASARVAKHLEGKMVKKVIFIPGRLINFVV